MDAPQTTSRTKTTVASRRKPPTRPTRTSRAGGVNPWVPNQHGAWAMLVVPIITGWVVAITNAAELVARQWVTLVALPVAWFVGYFSFFAAGLWWKARNPQRKASYAKPMVVYGAIAALCVLIAVVARPSLLWWAVAFVPLIAVAVWEVYRNRPRSVASGVSTTLASALMLPVVATSVDLTPGFHPDMQALRVHPAWLGMWWATVGMVLYFVGTIFYVKTMIREKNNPQFYRVSVGYHAVALVVSVVAVWALVFLVGSTPPPGTHSSIRLWVSAAVLILMMAAACARAVVIPRLAHKNPRAWTPKRVGIYEVPLCVLAAAVALVA